MTLGADRLVMQVRPLADALEPARQAMRRHLDAGAVDRHAVYRCELVLEELLLNIVRHGGPHAGAATIELSVTVAPRHVLLVFVDGGAPFDPTRQPDPVPPATLDEARDGGLGVLLVKRLSQHLHYRRDGSCNRVEVQVARGDGAGPAP